jgi:hypothetical protein
MRHRRIAAILILLASSPGLLSAADPTGVASFSKQIPGTDRRTVATSATFADKIYFELVVDAEDGEHPLLVNIYDGEGREVLNAQSTLSVSKGRGRAGFFYGFKRGRDAPGVWWYVAELDGTVIVSSSIEVSR